MTRTRTYLFTGALTVLPVVYLLIEAAGRRAP